MQARFAADAAGPSQVAARQQTENQREETAHRLTEVSQCKTDAFIYHVRVVSKQFGQAAVNTMAATAADQALNAWVSLTSCEEEPMKLSRPCQYERRIFRRNNARNKTI